MMSLPQTVTSITSTANVDRKSNLLQRNGSQLLQHAARLGLKRNFTTKVASSPQTRPRPSNSYTTPIKNVDNESIPNNHVFQATTVSDPTPNQQRHFHTYTKVPAFDMSSSKSLSSVSEKSQQLIIKPPNNQSNRYYRAFLSSVAYELKRRIILSDRIKNDIEYHNVFDGKEAVDKLREILGTQGRQTALRVGRALEAQRFFHDVNYENRLIDDIVEIYQFNELLFHHNHSSSNQSSTDQTAYSAVSTIINSYASDEDEQEEDDHNSMNTETTATTSTPIVQKELLPSGIYTELTYCYTPTCYDNLYPCYSYTCPKREKLRRRPHSVDTREKRVTAHTYEVQKQQQLWSQTVDDYIVLSTPANERKRQEIIFELVYTEENFLKDLEYVIKMWIEPLRVNDIIPKHRREEFIDKVFSNLTDIYQLSQRFTMALRARQQEHPIVSQISDIMQHFVAEFEPFVYYGARQHQAKHAYERERYSNPKFALFAEQTERDVSSRKLELNGYLTKPTTRLGRYTLLLDKIHSRTSNNHPDKENIPAIIEMIKQLLQRVNNAAGAAKNRFDLEQIQRHLSFKNKKDVVQLRLLSSGRTIIKQGVLRKTFNLDSTRYQAILFDHYFVVFKVKVVNTVEHYQVQRKPIPIEFLGVHVPALHDPNVNLQRKLSANALLSTLDRASSPVSPSSIGVANVIHSLNVQSTDLNMRVGLPIAFFHQGRASEDIFTLYAPNEPNLKSWVQAVQKQRSAKLKRQPAFDVINSVKRYEFFADIKVHHMVIFDQGKSYLLATDVGLYVGPNNSVSSGVPRKILLLEKVTQVHVLEDYQLLLVLANGILWQYPLDITINGQPEGIKSIQCFGRKIRANVPFFHVGECLDQTLICVPKSSSVNGTEIELFEPTMPKTELKKKSLLGRLSMRPTSSLSLTNTQVTQLKPIYSPCDVWAIDNTRSMLLLTTPLGIVAVDMKTKKADSLLDPSDKHLEFITKNEKIDEQMKLNPIIKRIAVFPVPNGNYLICYDKFAFYIDKKGRRAERKFKIVWEGTPTAFAYHHPYVIAFEQQFIEIRNAIDGHLEQVIQEKNVECLQNGHKSKDSSILGTMLDKTDSIYQQIFELKPTMLTK